MPSGKGNGMRVLAPLLRGPWVAHPYVNKLFGVIAPRASFRSVNRWACPCYPWTECTVLVCLSFDCDTANDTASLHTLVRLLSDYGLTASFAVVGSLVENDPIPYRLVAEAGHEILNHGYSLHSRVLESGQTVSCLTYKALSWKDVEEEISHNQRVIPNLLGLQPVGFRTPHFGDFQRPNQLFHLYRILATMGFIYSSSTLMWYAHQYGYLDYHKTGIIELPLSTLVGPPIYVLDSWNLVERARTRGRPVRLYEHWARALKLALDDGGHVFINTYFDPSHVANLDLFEMILADLNVNRRSRSIWVGTYSELAAHIRCSDVAPHRC